MKKSAATQTTNAFKLSTIAMIVGNGEEVNTPEKRQGILICLRVKC